MYVYVSLLSCVLSTFIKQMLYCIELRNEADQTMKVTLVCCQTVNCVSLGYILNY